MRCCARFGAAGFPGIFSRKELLAFFEDKFYAQERALVTKFIYYGLYADLVFTSTDANCQPDLP